MKCSARGLDEYQDKGLSGAFERIEGAGMKEGVCFHYLLRPTGCEIDVCWCRIKLQKKITFLPSTETHFTSCLISPRSHFCPCWLLLVIASSPSGRQNPLLGLSPLCLHIPTHHIFALRLKHVDVQRGTSQLSLMTCRSWQAHSVSTKGACSACSVTDLATIPLSNCAPHPCHCSPLSSAGGSITQWCWETKKWAFSSQGRWER